MDYERAPKRRFTRLLLDTAIRDGCLTLGSLWGRGGEARLAVKAGLTVLAADNDSATFAAMAEDAARNGYDYFAGNVRLLRRHVDVWHADFMGTPSPDNFLTVRHLATLTDKWLAVTVSTDHMKNLEMQGDAIVATLPAWLTFAAEGFTLEYLSNYARNERGLKMWVALLRRRSGHGNSHRIQPVQVSWAMKQRGYWASAAMYRDFGDLLPHRTGVASDQRTEYLKQHYAANRDRILARGREHYAAHRDETLARVRAHHAIPEVRERDRAYQREWSKRHPKTAAQIAKSVAYKRQYYLDHRDQMIAAQAARRRTRRAEAGQD